MKCICIHIWNLIEGEYRLCKCQRIYVCVCVSELICHYFGGALFYTHFLNVFTDYKCKDIVQYKNKTSKRTAT